ncbi:MAG: hypothetical protein HQL54_11985 [Magnetococcales bacterium]|nr:hypothetical protein [Magnetococcales bacterium]
MLLYINNGSSSSTQQREKKRTEQEAPEKRGMKFLFSGVGISNDADDVAGLVIPNPFIAFARDLDQLIFEANDGISMLDASQERSEIDAGGLPEMADKSNVEASASADSETEQENVTQKQTSSSSSWKASSMRGRSQRYNASTPVRRARMRRMRGSDPAHSKAMPSMGSRRASRPASSSPKRKPARSTSPRHCGWRRGSGHS